MNRESGTLHLSSTYGYEIDPCVILGVSPRGSLGEIRDAYREKARKHHPDHGGDEWAFKIVVRAYEILSTARVVGRASQEFRGPDSAVRPAPSHPSAHHEAPAFDPEGVRPGRKDPSVNPAYLVDVEVFRIGFELENPIDLVLLPPQDRTLSCSLNIAWPGQAVTSSLEPVVVSRILQNLSEVLETTSRSTRATSTWSRAESGRFEAWLSYPTASQAQEAFRTLHEALNAHGLGVNQWTRELFIPRNPK